MSLNINQIISFCVYFWCGIVPTNLTQQTEEQKRISLVRTFDTNHRMSGKNVLGFFNSSDYIFVGEAFESTLWRFLKSFVCVL